MSEKIKYIAGWVSGVLGAMVLVISVSWNIHTFIKKSSETKAKEIVDQERKYQHDLNLNAKVDLLVKSDSIRKVQDRNLSDTLKKLILKQNLMISKQNTTDKGVVEIFKLTGNIEKYLNIYGP
jgi:hypothetical protein